VKKDLGNWVAIFRLIGEIKNSCQEAEDGLSHAFKEVAKLRNYVTSIDKVLMMKYNYESTPEEKTDD